MGGMNYDDQPEMIIEEAACTTCEHLTIVVRDTPCRDCWEGVYQSDSCGSRRSRHKNWEPSTHYLKDLRFAAVWARRRMRDDDSGEG